MAKATKRMVEKVITQQVQDGVVLELNQNEAEILRVLVGSCRSHTLTHSIWSALKDVTSSKYDGNSYTVVICDNGIPEVVKR